LAGTAIAAASICATTSASGAPSGTSETSSTYLVVAASGASTAKAVSAVTAAGGTIVANYSQIGVVVARSSSSTFASTVKSTSGAEAVSTAGFGVHNGNDVSADAGPEPAGGTPAPGSDSLSGLQWDMNQIHAPEARAINGGSPSVIVGDIDTGLDYTHPDLAPNVDFSRSASCVSGAPDTSPAAWNDDNGHGTHTAGTIAAARNAIGIVGVAPNVKIAGIKAGNADGFFFPEAVVCSFIWAGDHGIAVTNNSYFADPWLFNCKNDPGQRAIWEAERRAIQYAQQKGTLVVAAAGNQADDLKHPTQDETSPDDTTPVTRDITNACAVVPTEVPGVISVSATGSLRQKSFYSSYGVVDVAAPGGDSVLQLTPAAPNGRVLSTWPTSLLTVTCLPARRLVDPASGAAYCYQQGTSMASPHAAGVAALIASAKGTRGSALAAALKQATNPIACPADTSAYDFFPALDGGALQTCSGGIGNNTWYGKGEVDALKAVS
jgi:subtilisin family serine protease